MAKMFDVSELVSVAVNDERTGVAFYSKLAHMVRDPELRKTFAALADQERYHRERFEKMLKDVGEHKPPDTYSEEYAGYVHALTTDRAFPDEAAAVKTAEECADDAAAIRIALGIERDTLVLLNEMRGMVREKDRAVVDEVIAEEQQHVVELTAARQRLQA